LGLASLLSEVAHRPYLPPCLTSPLSEVFPWPFLPPGLASLLYEVCFLAFSLLASILLYRRLGGCPLVSTATDLASPLSEVAHWPPSAPMASPLPVSPLSRLPSAPSAPMASLLHCTFCPHGLASLLSEVAPWPCFSSVRGCPLASSAPWPLFFPFLP